MQNRIVVLMFLLSVMSYVDRTAMSIAAPHMIREFGLSETDMGAVYSAFILSYALLMPPGGWLADRLGPRLVLGLTTAGTALFTGLTAAAGRLGTGALGSLLGIRLGMGVCTSPLYPACGRMTANWIPVFRRARVQGLVVGGAALGGAITPILFSWLIGVSGWRVSFVLAGAVTGVLAGVWLAAVKNRPDQAITAAEPPQREASSWRALLTGRNLILLSLSYFTLNYFEYIFFYWMYYYFGEIRKVGVERSAVYTTALWLTMLVMMPLGGWLADRLIPRWGVKTSRRAVSVTGMTLSAFLLYAGTAASEPWMVAALLSLALGFAASSEGPFWASAIDAGRGHSGAAGGIMNGVGNLGGLLAPVVTPYLAQRGGWAAGLTFASFVVLAGAAAWFFIDPGRSLEPPA